MPGDAAFAAGGAGIETQRGSNQDCAAHEQGCARRAYGRQMVSPTCGTTRSKS